MVAISQTFNQRNNDNNDKNNDKIDAAANAAPLDVDEKSHLAQFAAPGPLATPTNVDAETIADAARAGVDETPDAESETPSDADKLKAELNETVDAICASFREGMYEPPSQEEIESALRRAVDYICNKRNRCAGGDETSDAAESLNASGGAASSQTSNNASERPKRPGLTKTVTRYDDGEFVCWLPNDVDAGAELARFVEAASKTAVRVALAEAKANLLTQVLTLPTPRRAADIRQYYHQSVQGLALSVLAALGTDDEKFAVDNYLANAMRGASQKDDETSNDAASSSEDFGDQRKPDLRDVVKPETATVDPEAFSKLGKFYCRVSLPFIRRDFATFGQILEAADAVFPPNELLRPWNVADKTSAFCDALQNGGMTQAAALPLAKEAVANATEAASSLFWGGAGPEPKQRWKAVCVKPAFNVEIGDALKPANVGDKTSFSVDAAKAEAGE
ncbi:MAG: hypothetical protein J6K20_02135 [Thermoguttaceae bacterium]|nr:hypothetical protein [Thermoguttaceae bacterium]